VNSEQARQILLLYRPGTADAEEPDVVAAMEVARRDADLARWFAQHQAFQIAMREGFRQMPAPEHLKVALLTRHKIIPLPLWRQRPVWLAAAAAILLVAGWLAFSPRGFTPDRFADYRLMMVSKAERVYGMDITSSDMDLLRQLFARRGAPADYELPRGMSQLRLIGGVGLTWRTNPVAMVCYKRPDNKDVWLFVMNRSALKDPPPEMPNVDKVHLLMTASWTRGDKAYILAGPEEQDFLGRYF
jgi:hypothetical protein